jgi:L-serine dehydratase
LAISLAVTEVNAAMGKVWQHPQRGPAEFIPGILLSIAEDRRLTDEQIIDALVGQRGAWENLLQPMLHHTFRAEGGCQANAEQRFGYGGTAAVFLCGGSLEQSLDAAAMALKGLLGLVCDPVAGLVEVPCSNAMQAPLPCLCLRRNGPGPE